MSDDWHLIFRPEGAGPPTACRIRRLLKIALRRCGLRCIGYGTPKPPDNPHDPAATIGYVQPRDAKDR